MYRHEIVEFSPAAPIHYPFLSPCSIQGHQLFHSLLPFSLPARRRIKFGEEINKKVKVWTTIEGVLVSSTMMSDVQVDNKLEKRLKEKKSALSG